MITDVIRAIQDAIPKIRSEEFRLDRKHGIDRTKGFDLFAEKSIERAFEDNVHEKELEETLMACDQESLLKVEALMYYGRDNDGSTFTQKLEYLREHYDSKAMIVRTMLEKLPALTRYLQKGEAKLRESGMSVDTI